MQETCNYGKCVFAILGRPGLTSETYMELTFVSEENETGREHFAYSSFQNDTISSVGIETEATFTQLAALSCIIAISIASAVSNCRFCL